MRKFNNNLIYEIDYKIDEYSSNYENEMNQILEVLDLAIDLVYSKEEDISYFLKDIDYFFTECFDNNKLTQTNLFHYYFLVEIINNKETINEFINILGDKIDEIDNDVIQSVMSNKALSFKDKIEIVKPLIENNDITKDNNIIPFIDKIFSLNLKDITKENFKLLPKEIKEIDILKFVIKLEDLFKIPNINEEHIQIYKDFFGDKLSSPMLDFNSPNNKHMLEKELYFFRYNEDYSLSRIKDNPITIENIKKNIKNINYNYFDSILSNSAKKLDDDDFNFIVKDLFDNNLSTDNKNETFNIFISSFLSNNLQKIKENSNIDFKIDINDNLATKILLLYRNDLKYSKVSQIEILYDFIDTVNHFKLFDKYKDDVKDFFNDVKNGNEELINELEKKLIEENNRYFLNLLNDFIYVNDISNEKTEFKRMKRKF